VRVSIGLALCTLITGVIAGAGSSQLPPTSKPCGTTDGPPWTQTINLNGYMLNGKPPRPAPPNLKVIHGSRYLVFVDRVRCTWATRQVSRLLPLRTLHRVQKAAPEGYACYVRGRGWFRDGWNGDAVRRTEPPTSWGICSTQTNDAIPGATFRWTPAKPCRAGLLPRWECHRS
jgi:hypothetical protein